MNNFFISLCAF